MAGAQAAVGKGAGPDFMKVLQCHSWDIVVGMWFLEWLWVEK